MQEIEPDPVTEMQPLVVNYMNQLDEALKTTTKQIGKLEERLHLVMKHATPPPHIEGQVDDNTSPLSQTLAIAINHALQQGQQIQAIMDELEI